MALNILAGSYQRYKNDTNIFITWLSKTAAAYGYKSPKREAPPEPPAPTPSIKPVASNNTRSSFTLAENLRAQAEKKAKKREVKKKSTARDETAEAVTIPTLKHSVKTQELLRQAEIVSRNAKAKLPDAILKVIQRAIHARKRCAAWFEETGIDNGHSTEGHLHFIAVLEKALQTLKPDYASTRVSRATGTETRPEAMRAAKNCARPVQDLSGLSNRFSNLNVEDTEDIAETTMTLQSLSSNSKITSKSVSLKLAPAIDVYELDYDDSFERFFDVFCFFEDLHRIQDFLTETWTEYRRGSLDLMTAAIITNAAFDLVRREEQELTLLTCKSEKLSYLELASMVFFIESLREGKNALVRKPLRITPFDNFIFLPTGRSVQKFEKMLEKNIEYPQPVIPARVNYFSQQDMLNLPEVQRMEKEDEFISQYLMDLSFKSKVEAMHRQILDGATPESVDKGDAFKDFQTNESPVGDEFSRGFERMRVKGEVSTWFVFACRILIDLQEILGDKISHGWRELRKTAAESKQNLHARREGQVLVVDGERWRHGRGDDIVMKLFTECNLIEVDLLGTMKISWMKEKAPEGHRKFYSTFEEAVADRPELAKKMSPEDIKRLKPTDEHESDPFFQAMKQKSKEFNLQPISPSQDESFIYTHNPVYCGFKMFEISLDNELAGTFFENHHQVIFCIAHLYNASIQSGLIKCRWAEMEFVIQSHMSVLFAGKLPENEKDFASRFGLQLGFSTTAFAKNARTKKRPSFKQAFRSGMSNGPQMTNAKGTDFFRYYFLKSKTMEQCLYQLEASIGDENSQSLTTTSKFKNANKNQYQRQLTPIHLLQHTLSYLPSQVQRMQIDYISLVRTCCKILRDIRMQLEEQLHIDTNRKASNEDSNDAGLIIMTLEILNEAADMQVVSEELFRKEMKVIGPIVGGPQLEISAEILGKFIGTLSKPEGKIVAKVKATETSDLREELSEAQEVAPKLEKKDFEMRERTLPKTREESSLVPSQCVGRPPKEGSWESRAARAFC